jgi:hypothetical protein
MTNPDKVAFARSYAGTHPSLDFLEWGMAECESVSGERSGDRCMVAPTSRGALIAVVDGLGHGDEADRAAETALGILGAHAGEPIWSLLQRCHAALLSTRGATMTLADIDAGEGMMTWGGIGNVQGSLVRSARGRRPETALRLAGAVGFILPRVQPSTTRLSRGDVVILATNGVAPEFADNLLLLGEPRAIASRILRRHARLDQALVLAGRFLGSPNG